MYRVNVDFLFIHVLLDNHYGEFGETLLRNQKAGR